MPGRFTRGRLGEIWRYYQAGVINTLFGFGLYALFVKLGCNIYVAQIIAHILGVAFNYVSYSRHVFRAAGPAKARFVASYAVNYLASVAMLALAARFIASPYIAGAVSILLVSLANYFVLKHFVFTPREGA